MIQVVPITENHQHAYYDLSQKNTERLADFFPITIEKTETPEKCLESIKLYNMLAQKNDLHVLMIENDRQPVGFIILKNIDKKADKCEIVYFIDKNSEGKGYTSAAVQDVIKWAFETLGINKIYCRVAIDDIPANRIASKNGFELEGTLRQELRTSSGMLIDLNYYGLLKQSLN